MTSSKTIWRSGNILFIVVFLIALVLPAIDQMFELDGTSPPTENRTLAEKPTLPKTKADFIAFPEKFEAYINDHFGFRNKLIRWHSIVKMLWLGQSTTPSVVIGKNGWLFYDELDSRDDHRGVLTLLPQELDTIRIHLENRYAWVTSRNIPCFIVFAPDKESIYPEYLPDRWKNVHARTRMDQILAYLKAHSTLPVLDLRPALLQAKSLGALYYRTDSHWNELGAYVGYREILSTAATARPALRPRPLSDFDVRVKPGMGQDLAHLMALGDRIGDETVTLTPKTPRVARLTEPTGERDDYFSVIPGSRLPVAAVFRDSFTDAMIPFMAEHFSRAFYPRHDGFDYALIEKERPDVVIIEIVERALTAQLLPPNPLEVDSAVVAQRFDRATDARLQIRPGDGTAGLESLDDTKVISNADHILLQAPGSGVSLLLPAFDAPPNRTLLFSVDLALPFDAEMRIFYKNQPDQDYSEDRSLSLMGKEGRRKMYFELPVRNIADRLRLDLGINPGNYKLHGLEIRAVPGELKNSDQTVVSPAKPAKPGL